MTAPWADGTRVLVVGVGSIGRRHLMNLKTLGGLDLWVFDPLAKDAAEATQEAGATMAATLAEGLAAAPAIVWICAPPARHAGVAIDALDAGAHVFVEKPISPSLEEADAVIAAARRNGRQVAVGYNLRFHAGLRRVYSIIEEGLLGDVLSIRAEAGQHLSTWRPNTDYRQGYIAHRETGGGIILDGSHELDYVRWLGGEVVGVQCIAESLGDLGIQTEDTAAIILRLASGAIAEVHVDCIQRGYSRKCKVIGSEGTAEWDIGSGVRWCDSDGNWTTEAIVPDVNDMYVDEAAAVVDAMISEVPPPVTAEDGRRALGIALAAQRAAEARAEVAV